MANRCRMPETEHRRVLKWWIHGYSARDIARMLGGRGVAVSHVSVWNFIWRFVDVGKDPSLAALLIRGRQGARWGRKLALPEYVRAKPENEILLPFTSENSGKNDDLMVNAVNVEQHPAENGSPPAVNPYTNPYANPYSARNCPITLPKTAKEKIAIPTVPAAHSRVAAAPPPPQSDHRWKYAGLPP